MNFLSLLDMHVVPSFHLPHSFPNVGKLATIKGFLGSLVIICSGFIS